MAGGVDTRVFFVTGSIRVHRRPRQRNMSQQMFEPTLARYEALMDVVRSRKTSRAYRTDVA
jgi:hypothetical protein